jgi:flagellar motor switch/type III secretory pathway protein FliN
MRCRAMSKGAVTSTRIRPFPWRSLDATTREEVSSLRDVNRWARGHVRPERLASALSELVGAEIELLIGRAQPLRVARALDHGVGVILARADAPDGTSGALIEAEGALAANVVARALKRPTPLFVNAGVAPSSGAAGAFAAVVAATARRAHAGVALRVLGAGPARTLEAEFARNDPEILAASLTVLVAHDAFAARVILSRSTALASPVSLWDVRALAALGSTPLAVPIVACDTVATAEGVAALRPGDAFVPDGLEPLTRGGHGRIEGPVFLAAPSSDLGLRAELGQDGRLVLRGGLEPLLAAEAHMDPGDKDAVVAALGEVPVVVRVEIGEALMPARDWASLGRGDVIGLGRRVGEPVLLRVGGVVLARGELVQLDGEVGVRILDRLVGDWKTS